MTHEPIKIARRLNAALVALDFLPPVSHVYNPTLYARASFEAYLRAYGRGEREILLLGMNPGPFGMAQTGVPFGEVSLVRDWLRIEGPVGRPALEHPKRPVLGFACPRREVSGARLWGWARERYGRPERFFARFFVANYCPLAFLTESGANLTPDRLPAAEQAPLLAACDQALRELAAHFRPRWVVGVGHFAAARARAALAGRALRLGRMLHPSPASPAANRGWAKAAERNLEALGIEL